MRTALLLCIQHKSQGKPGICHMGFWWLSELLKRDRPIRLPAGIAPDFFAGVTLHIQAGQSPVQQRLLTQTAAPKHEGHDLEDKPEAFIESCAAQVHLKLCKMQLRFASLFHTNFLSLFAHAGAQNDRLASGIQTLHRLCSVSALLFAAILQGHLSWS